MTWASIPATACQPAPSSMTARAASMIWLRGKRAATACNQGGDPSSENQTPDKKIMGKLMRLSKPLASSSF